MDAEELIRQASQSVRTALEAAQRRADEIVREAEAEAQRIRAKADTEARERLDEVRRALEQLEAGLVAKPAPRTSNPEPESQAAPVEPIPQGKVSTEELIERLKAGGQSTNAEPEAAPAVPNQAPTDDAGGARLVAMKLALDGTARDEARKQLAAEYEVDDLDSLLDEVYAKAGK